MSGDKQKRCMAVRSQIVAVVAVRGITMSSATLSIPQTDLKGNMHVVTHRAIGGDDLSC